MSQMSPEAGAQSAPSAPEVAIPSVAASNGGSGGGNGRHWEEASSLPEASTARLVAGVAFGVGAAALGGWILGEYPFTGVMPYLTGVLFALVVAEIMLSISRRSGVVVAIPACIATAGGIFLAVWIQSTEGLVPIPIGGWVAIALGAVIALVRGGLISGGWRARRSREG
ncbi:MAG TPA: hypothetical protein VHT30_12490 [Acidimicrobiales bacterium]|nr:hypothetical protein [Acidimicrobiales bacterium]